MFRFNQHNDGKKTPSNRHLKPDDTPVASGSHLLFLFIVWLSTLAGAAGCGTSCPLDADGNGALTEEELSTFNPPSDPAETVNLFLGCQSLLEQLGLNSPDQLGLNPPEQLGLNAPEQLALNSPALINMPADRTVNEGEVFIVDASLITSGEGEVDLRAGPVGWGEFALNRVGPLRWEVTAPLLDDREETTQGFLEFVIIDPNNCNPPEPTCRRTLGTFLVTVVNTNIAADRLSGWWSFSSCTHTCGLQFRFDGSGTLVDWRGHDNSNDPEAFIPQWHDVSFSGSISESGASLEFSGRYWQPQWRNVWELEHDAYFNPATTVDYLSYSKKQELVRRVGTMKYCAVSFENSREPSSSREGPNFVQFRAQATYPLVICTSEGCKISEYYVETWEGTW